VRTGQRPAADSVLRQARQQIAPDRAAFVLACCHDALGQPAEAEKLFREAIEAQPNDFTLLAAVADFYRRHDEETKARAFLEKLLQPDLAAPVVVQVRARRQLALIVAGSDQTRALDLLAFNVGWRGNSVADERARALVLGFAPKKQLQALQMFDATLTAQPATPDELLHFARLCETAGNDARSRAILLELVTNHPHEPQYLARYIRSQASTGDLDDARAYFRKLEQLEPKSARAHDLRRLLNPR
jgi:predicted Zn-dependent protease